MKSSLVCLKVSVKKSPIHGYGVFAEQDIPADTIIEECHTLLAESKIPCFDRYYFNVAGKFAIALGHGVIYNHSDDPNACSEWDKEHGLVIIKSEKEIKKGDEIFISYGEQYFNNRNIKIKTGSWRNKWRNAFPLITMVMRFAVIMSGFYYVLHVVK